MKSVRQLVAEMQTEIRETDIQPERARVLLTKLSSLLGNCNDEIRVADAEYASVLLEYLGTEDAANRARIKAETSPAYQRKRIARDTKELVVELVRSLKHYLRSVSDEMQLSR